MLCTQGAKAKTQKEWTYGELFTQLSEGCGMCVLLTLLCQSIQLRKLVMFEVQTFHANGVQAPYKYGANSIVQ